MNSNFETAFSKYFPKFGTNKSREILRLIYEISKIEKVSPEHILKSLKENSYEKVKQTLLKRRYPRNFGKVLSDAFYLPKYSSETDPADISQTEFCPQTVYWQSGLYISPVFEKVKMLFPGANFIEFHSLKELLKNEPLASTGFNGRLNNLFLVKEKYDFFKRCPCTSGVVNCGYSIMNLGMGCAYECSYCFLQAYQNIPGIVIPCNISDYLSDEKIISFSKGFFNYKRIGSGEFTDSLIFDHITAFSIPITDFFKSRKEIFFEFKTKSLNIENLLSIGGTNNIVAAWSVNSLKMQKETEFKTPSIQERLNAAKKCALAGFSTAFHFDPVIFYEKWKEGYKETVDMIFDTVPNESIKWISIGTLRMPAIQKTVMEKRFPENEILNTELLLGQDYKLRYDEDLRIEIYRYLNSIISDKKSKAITYLCMEDTAVWKKSGML